MSFIRQLLSVSLPLLAAAAAPRPHIVMNLIDDWGHANWALQRLRNGLAPSNEWVTPTLDQLAKDGITLDRFYVHKYCSPSRSSLQTGRLPVHVNVINSDLFQRNTADPEGGAQGCPRNMTGLGEVMKRGGYATHFSGKWNAGSATFDRLPVGRGYDTSLFYAGYRNDEWTMVDGTCPLNATTNVTMDVVDLWDGNGPARGLNNSANCSQANQAGGCVYEDDLFLRRVLDTIEAHDASQPLFLVWATHGIHTPYEVPQRYLDRFAFIPQAQRRFYAAMVSHVDDMVGNVTNALKAKGMWSNTLWLTASDNGGPVTALTGANNFPLRGGKLTNWEAGIRANAFASGGFIPPALRGSVNDGLLAIADLYTTFASLAGVDATDARAAAAGLPPVDGLDVSGLFTGANSSSPRLELPVGVAYSADGDDDPPAGPTYVQALIRADGIKLILGQVGGGFFQGPDFPNASGWPTVPPADCGNLTLGTGGCLFNVRSDPHELADVAGAFPAVAAEMRSRIAELQRSVYSPDRGGDDPAACAAAVSRWGGFVGPFF